MTLTPERWLTNGDTHAKDLTKATDAEKIAHYESFSAYCGTFRLDPENSTVYHYPRVARSPSHVGSTNRAHFEWKVTS